MVVIAAVDMTDSPLLLCGLESSGPGAQASPLELGLADGEAHGLVQRGHSSCLVCSLYFFFLHIFCLWLNTG